jgi:hypothetical protein
MSLASRTAGLLGYIEDRRRAECGSILDEARAGAAAILKAAHSAARPRVREALEEERRRARAAVASAQARLESRRRVAGQQRTAAVLALARARLADALRKCWTDADSRSLWVGHHVSGALRVLPKRGWEIHHPSSWPREERRLLDERLAREGLPAPRYVADETIVGGIRIQQSDTVLDGTLAAILADSAEVEGRLLHYLESEAP